MLKSKISKLNAAILTISLTATMFTGCGKSQNKTTTDETTGVTQTIKYNLAAEPKTIDPALNDAVDGGTVICNAFEGLTRLDENEKPVAGVATKWDVSSDGLKYTFHLRKNAKWSDGKGVVAGDFEYAWKRALNPATASDYAYQLFYLKNGENYNSSQSPDYKGPKVTASDVGVKAVDDYTLEVNLEYPTAYFLSLMAFPTYAPVRKDVIEKNPTDWALKPETYVCNGPFKMKEWKPKDSLNFVKNNNYWNAKKIKLQNIEYKMIEQSTSALAGFKTGSLDFIESPPAPEIPGLLKSGTAKTVPYLGTYYLEFNLDPKAASVNAAAAKALSDVKVRKALTLAIDRKAITQNVTKAGEVPAASFVPKGIPEGTSGKDFASKEYFKPGGDVAQAKKLLAEAGYPDGKGFPSMVYLYNTNEGHQNIAQAIQEMWRKNLNINVELQNQEWKVFQKTRTSKNYLIARGGWIADYTDPMTFLDLFTSKSGNNDPGYKNPKYDAAIDAAKKETNSTKRMTIMHQAEDMLMADMPVDPIYYYTNVVCIKNYVKGVHKSPLGFVIFDNAYVTKH